MGHKEAHVPTGVQEVPENSIFARRLDSSCLVQYNKCLLQKSVKSGVLLPNARKGLAMPEGSAIATTRYIYPSWVGHDIGCGALSIPTNFDVDQVKRNARKIFKDLKWKSRICEDYRTPVLLPHNLHVSDLSPIGRAVVRSTDCLGVRQLGTLGGGSHFLDISADVSGMVWLTVHAGSRDLGTKIATSYMRLADNLHKGSSTEHASLDSSEEDGRNYYNDMIWLQSFASENRHRIAEDAAKIINTYCKGKIFKSGEVESSHNHIEVTNMIFIHRNNSTPADKDTMVNVLGNMRDGTYLVRGRGNYDSLYSCSSGAGRYCPKAEVRSAMDLGTLRKDMRGIITAIQKKYLVESPKAYKDIGNVLLQQDELVKVCNHLTPIINLKG